MRIYLRRADFAVAQECLDKTDIMPTLKQVLRKTVTE
jgi:hypothetical protein